MQQYLSKLSTAPIEPVSLEDMLAWLKQDPGIDDDVIAGLIIGARVYAEGYQRRSLVSEQWRLRVDAFPYFMLRDGFSFYEGVASEMWGLPYGLYHPDMRRFALELPRGPLVSIDAFTYLDSTGTSQTLAPNAYQVINGDDVNPRLFPADGTYWPLTRFDPAAITIDFTAGFAAENLPQNTVVALKMLVASWYGNRDGAQDVPPLVKTLLYQDAVVLL